MAQQIEHDLSHCPADVFLVSINGAAQRRPGEEAGIRARGAISMFLKACRHGGVPPCSGGGLPDGEKDVHGS
ncbi:hypothetical protein [Streptomyces nodosus]|uniref:hypothetical protein n=1 Tax=Streptomyces nodosus TaxID=40318 RepID=UPI0037F2C886